MSDCEPRIIGMAPPRPGVKVAGTGRPGAGFCAPSLKGGGHNGRALEGSAVTIDGWPRQLIWEVFTECPGRPPGEKEVAQIHSEARAPKKVTFYRVDGLLRVTRLRLALRTIAVDTLVVGPLEADELLKHEQGHYDITGLLAGENFAAKGHRARNLQVHIDRILKKYRHLADTLTKWYGRQTEHSRNWSAQKRWDDQIRNAKRTGSRSCLYECSGAGLVSKVLAVTNAMKSITPNA